MKNTTKSEVVLFATTKLYFFIIVTLSIVVTLAVSIRDITWYISLLVFIGILFLFYVKRVEFYSERIVKRGLLLPIYREVPKDKISKIVFRFKPFVTEGGPLIMIYYYNVRNKEKKFMEFALTLKKCKQLYSILEKNGYKIEFNSDFKSFVDKVKIGNEEISSKLKQD